MRDESEEESYEDFNIEKDEEILIKERKMRNSEELGLTKEEDDVNKIEDDEEENKKLEESIKKLLKLQREIEDESSMQKITVFCYRFAILGWIMVVLLLATYMITKYKFGDFF